MRTFQLAMLTTTLTFALAVRLAAENPNVELVESEGKFALKFTTLGKAHYAYQFFESEDLKHWTVPRDFIRGDNSNLEYITDTVPSFVRVEEREAFGLVSLNESLADTIFNDGDGDIVFTYADGTNGILRASETSDGITLTAEANWFWGIPDGGDLNLIRFTVDVYSYEIPQLNFKGSPTELAAILEVPVPTFQFTDIFFETPENGHFVRNQWDTSESLTTEEPIPFELP